MPAKAAKPDPELTFETAVERLENLVIAMESDKMPLSDLLVRYEEGTRLVQFCQEQLAAAEKRIEFITRTAGGAPKAEPFELDKAVALPSTAAKSPEEVNLF